MNKANYTEYNHYAYGIYGFNATLTGITIVNTTESGFLNMVIVVIMFGILSAFITNALIKGMGAIPFLTLPFNLTAMWFVGGALQYSDWRTHGLTPHLGLGNTHFNPCTPGDKDFCNVFVSFFVAILRGISNVVFAGNEIAGVFILGGIAFCSFRAAWLALLGSFLGWFTACLMGVEAFSVYTGLWGYNCVLTAIAVGGAIFGDATLHTFVWGLIGAVLTAFLFPSVQMLLAPTGLQPFTLPSCFVSIVLIGANVHIKEQ